MSEDEAKPPQPAASEAVGVSDDPTQPDAGEHLYPLFEGGTAQDSERRFVTNIFRLFW